MYHHYSNDFASFLVQPLNLSPRLDTTKPKCKWFDVGFSEVGQPAEWKVNEAEMNTNPQKSVSLDITPNSPELVTRVRACHIAMSVCWQHTHTQTHRCDDLSSIKQTSPESQTIFDHPLAPDDAQHPSTFILGSCLGSATKRVRKY